MDIISFFRSIDGILYYILLVTNTILIFAIIGYLGEKNNEKFNNVGINTTSTPNPGGEFNLDTASVEKRSDASIPTVAPTMASTQTLGNISNGVIGQNNANPNSRPNIGVQNGVFVNNGAINNMSNNMNMTQPIIRPEDNEVDPNEKAPAVLVINSDNTNIPK